MSIALKIGDEDSQVKGLIYLDAVTAYTKTLGGKVTSHPVDSGVDISDHFISNNQKFTLEGIVTNVDVTGYSDLVSIDGEKPINASPRPSQPTISGQDKTLKYLPSSVKQFFENTGADVYTSSTNTDVLASVEYLFEDLLRGVYYNQVDKKWRNKMTLTTLYEMSGNTFINAKTDLVITDVVISETVDTGEALTLSISLEKIRRVTLEQVDAPSKVNPSDKKKVSAKESKGKQEGVSGTSATTTNSDNNAPKKNFRQALDFASSR